MKIVKPQSIALISDHADPSALIGLEEAGGQNVYVRQVGEQLANLGWQVDMFTRKTNPSSATVVHHSSSCRTIRLIAGPQRYIPREKLFEFMPQFIQSFQAFQSQQDSDYPVIHTHYWLSAWIGLQLQRSNGVHLLHTYHSLGAIKYQSLDQYPPHIAQRITVEKEILERANCVIATSPQEEVSLRRLVSQEGKIQVIPCGADISIFREHRQDHARTTLGWNLEGKIVLFVGRFDPRKGIETLVKAIALLKSSSHYPLSLVIVGGSTPTMPDGLERLRIESMVEELGLQVETLFTDRIDHHDLPLYYAAADVCVVPSYYEPFGLVAIESMACGTPVIASAVGGLPSSVIPEITGLLVPPQDSIQLASAIRRILENKSWGRMLGRQGAAYVREHFDWKKIGYQLSSLYSSLIESRLMAADLKHDPHRDSSTKPLSKVIHKEDSLL